MKNLTKIGLITGALSLMATVSYAAPTQIALQRGLADWVSLVAEILSFVCLAVFIVYTGKFISSNSKGTSDSGEGIKITNGVKNGIMTALVGIGICQAVVIVAQALFIK